MAPINAEALDWKVIGGCSEDIIYQGSLDLSRAMTLGQATVRAFDLGQVEYQGNDAAIDSINGVGNSVEILNRRQMRAYGWCFSVNGQVPDNKLPEEIQVSNKDSIVWFYAFSWYDQQWKEMCLPAYQEPPTTCSK